MSAETVGIIGIVVLVLLLLFTRMWIGLAMATVGLFGVAYLQGFKQAFSVVSRVPYENIAFYPMAALPLFVLMGVIVGNTGIGEDLYNTAYKWVGQLRGGLASATILACAFFAAITGSSATGTIVMGKVALPQMRKYQYDDKLATGSIASAGTLGILIPPSMGFILYGILTEVSIGELFMAGILPGILLTALFVGTIMIVTAVRPQAGPAGPKTTFKEKIESLKRTWHMVLLLLLVLGGIYGGIFTPTEAGAVGAFGAIVIATASRRLTRKKLYDTLMEAGVTTAMILFLVVGAFIFMRFLGISKLPFLLAEVVSQANVPPYAILIGIIIVYVILGMFLEIYSCVVLTIPIIYPAILALGFDPVWFGVIIVLVIEMGLVTPPVGINVYILSGMTDTPLDSIFRGIVPFFIAMIICVVILAVFPQIALFIPRTM